MGWASGSGVAYPIIKAIKKNVPDQKARRKIYKALIDAFEDADCDTLYECCGVDPIYDEFFGEDDE